MSDKKTTKTKSENKILRNAREFCASPTFLGILISLFFVFVTYNYYEIKTQNEYERLKNNKVRNFLFKSMEWLDLKSTDGRFLLRGTEEPDPQSVLLTIDNRSVEEIGRWPWSREKMAFIVSEMNKYEAAALGFDIIFSESEVNQITSTLTKIEEKHPELPEEVRKTIEEVKQSANPDALLTMKLDENRSKVVLGVFNEEVKHDYLPYQDYCRNEAFLRDNAEKFVKLNTTFIVNDESDYFVDLEFDKIFAPIFTTLEKVTTERELKKRFQKESIEQLDSREKNALAYSISQENLRYCERWLTAEDEFFEPLKETYLAVFGKSEHLIGMPAEEAKIKFQQMVKPLPVSQHSSWTINIDQIQDATDYSGSFNAEQDADGSIRKISLLFRTGNRIGTSFIPSLALQTYLIAKGYRADIEFDIDPRHPEQKIITKFQIVNPQTDPEQVIANIPVDEQGRMKINYAGGSNMYPYLPAKELFNGKETATISQQQYIPELDRWEIVERTVNKAEFIKGKSFIFGATATGIYDLRVTPFEKNYPGPETHVTAMGNLFSNNFIQQIPNEEAVMMSTVIFLGILLSLAISHAQAIAGFLITFGSLGILILIDQYLFRQGYVAAFVLPGTLVVFLYVFLFFFKYFTEEQKKKQLRSTFSKYVSPAVVDEILKSPENIELGGKKQRMAVFFSDLRNFTTISEKLQATELSDVLNLYLTPMTQIVFANKGTLDKYIGDAVMAFFGAPISYPDHSKYACRCALESIRRLDAIRTEVNTKFPGRNIPIEIGIGINTADVSVGNMGSDIVRSYTVMGDGVNLASRLEGITKEYGVKIVISEFVYQDVKNDFTCRELDWVRVKGKLEPVRIFELVSEGPADPKTMEMLNYFNEGFKVYHEKDFVKAKELFQKSLELAPGDAPSELYIERCDEYIQEPPAENWDGVFVMKTK